MWLLMSVLARPGVAGVDADNLDRVLQAAADRGELVAAVRVVDGDRVLLERGYGGASADATCRIGSVTKSFTAGAVHALVDEGRLSIDEAIGDVLPEVHARIGAGPSIEQLLSHHGGISDPQANPWMRPPTWEEQAGVMLPQLTQPDEPGDRYRYNNFGYTLLAAAVQSRAGEPFESVLRSRLFDPLGLHDSGIAAAPNRDARLIRGRLPSAIGLLDVQHALPRLIVYEHRWPMGGAGAMTSSPADLVRWAEGLRDGDILTDGARAALRTPYGDSDYASGWKVQDGRVWHNGALEPLGIYAYLRWSLQDDVVVAFCGTPGVGAVEPEWRKVIESALDGESVEPPTVTTGALGHIAALSHLQVHRLVGLLGIVGAGLLGRTRRGRLGVGLLGAAVALVGLGFTHILAGVAAAGLALGAAIVRMRWARGAGSWIGVGLGGLALAGAVVWTVLLGGFGWLVDNVWAVGGG